MKKLLSLGIFIVLNLISVTNYASEQTKKIGIIIPLQHQAMDEIVSGFTQTLRSSTSILLQFKIANAQADLNLERAIVNQFKNQQYDFVVPIGTGATQMSAAIMKNQTIISLASDFSDSDRKQQKPCHIAVVQDEISPQQSLQFVHQVYPQLKNLVLIHSAEAKVFPEVKEAIAAGKKIGISIHPMMMSSLSELYSLAHILPPQTEGIFILKDSLIVSGITTLALVAEKQHLPLITSDEGSVQNGAAFAIGVHERQIGVEGAKLVAEILAGKPICSLPIVKMKNLIVFINRNRINKENQNLSPILIAAKVNHYAVEYLGTHHD